MSGQETENNQDKSSSTKASPSLSLSASLDENMALFRRIFANDGTLRTRMINNAYSNKIRCGLIYIDGMADRDLIQEAITRPLMRFDFGDIEDLAAEGLIDKIQTQIINISEVALYKKPDDLISAIVAGYSVLFVDGISEGLSLNVQGWETRAISEPTSERGIRGPREGFTESLPVNLSLIRRRILTPDLKFIISEVGTRSKTPTCLVYLESLASPDILQELQKRLKQVKVDHILDTGYLAELVADEPYSPFDMIGNTERPDTVVGKIMEGRIALLIEGSPFALTLPYLFVENFQTSEDYYLNYFFASGNRMLRVLGAFLSISIPAVYLSLVSFSQEMLPTMLLLSIANARKAVPFPTIVEAILMLTMFEVLREAGARIPAAIGQAVSIVGALVLGQAAVDARIVSAPMVIVVGVTGITSLLNPRIIGPLLVIRLLLLLSSFLLGLYGYFLGLLAVVVHLMSLRSFGVSYMLKVGSIKPEDIKDTIIRAPWWHIYLHPVIVGARNRKRKPGNRP
ncbi:MAG: spore germination protein [Paenibacillus sp.]|nr:spore germination protein [Paenibacillus sp.]